MLDDTLVFYIIDDNGASAERTQRHLQQMLNFNGLADIECRGSTDRLDKFGGPGPNHYSVGWAHTWIPLSVDQTSGLALGGTRNGTMHWLTELPLRVC